MLALPAATLLVSAAACSTQADDRPGRHGSPTPRTCTAPAGGRCPGAEQLSTALVGHLHLSRDGRTISGRFRCGGRMIERQTATRVTITYLASRVGPGALACALVPVSVRAASPIGAREIVDGVTQRPLHVAG